MEKVINFCKKEIVLIISAVLAFGSAFIIKPDAKYIDYIDIRVLVLLFCLMTVVGSAKEQGLFQNICKSMLKRVKSVRSVALILILLCFFGSMLITNDVALITFVPMTLIAMSTQSPAYIIFVIVMQTIAANIGSSLTAVGNPQNLFLSGFYNVSAVEFLKLTSPFVFAGLLLIVVSTFIKIKPEPVNEIDFKGESINISKLKVLISFALFALCVASVLHAVNYLLALAVVCIVLLISNRKAFLHIDISLLLTFIFLFVFVGNMARVDVVKNMLSACILNKEVAVSALASQFISNVPAALLLSGFTSNGGGLIVGTNVGGLGTPIASMASLISLRIYQNSENADTKRYIAVFSIFNFLFLAILLTFEILKG